MGSCDDPQADKNKRAQQIIDRLKFIFPPKISFGGPFHNERLASPNGKSDGGEEGGVKFNKFLNRATLGGIKKMGNNFIRMEGWLPPLL